jgi:hypothetical protein
MLTLPWIELVVGVLRSEATGSAWSLLPRQLAACLARGFAAASILMSIWDFFGGIRRVLGLLSRTGRSGDTERVDARGVFFVRFMDDVLVLAPTRWKLRKAVKRVNEVLCSLRLQKHPDVTFVGRVGRGFDFLGYQFKSRGLAVAEGTRARFVERCARLQEQEVAGLNGPDRLRDYVRRWERWAGADLVAVAGVNIGRSNLTR